MTLTQLEYVLAVAKHKHFGKAAKASFVTQPTLSMQLQKLEDELQIIIFDRSKSPIRPTIEGEIIISQAKKIIHEQNRLFSIVEESKEEISGDLRIGVIPTLSPFVIPMFAQEFSEVYPKVNLHIEERKTEEIISLLKNDEIDAGILVTPLYEKSIEEKVLYYEPFHLFASSNHPISKKAKIKEEDLDIDEIWLLDKGNCFRDQVLNICGQSKNKDYTNPLNFSSGNFETLKNMVLKGTGYTLLPQMAVESLPTAHKKLIKDFSKPVPTREVSLVHSKNIVKRKLISALEEEILANIPDNLRNLKGKDLEVVDI